MGVPKFYRWLSERYPHINQPVTRYRNEESKLEILEQQKDKMEISRSVEFNELTPSPEISHLYIDLNGILHGCAHNNANQSNLGELEEDELNEQEKTNVNLRMSHDEIIDHVETYLDRLVSDIARPTKLIYIAVDGVAPRAKLNQQRARRFKTGAESKTSLESDYEAHRNSSGTLSGTMSVDLDMLQALEKKDVAEDDGYYKENSITPGTVFMQEITKRLQTFVLKRASDGVWKNTENEIPEIIFSGGNVPGEGEHKIMDYLRSLDLTDESKKKGNHCIVGQDGDLIMLSLMTKLRNICLLREHVVFQTLKELKQAPSKSAKDGIAEYINNHKFEFLRIGILRDYIALEFGCGADSNDASSSPNMYDLNRTIDDILFLFLFIGNDFLPNIPSIDIGDGGLDILLDVYKSSRSKWDVPYLTKNGQILEFSRLQSYFSRVQNLLYNAKQSNWREHLVGDNVEPDNNDTSQDSGKDLLDQFKDLFVRSIFDLDKEGQNKSKPLHIPSNMKKLQNAPVDRLEKIYYATKFPSKTSRNEVVASYFQTVQWVLDYYYRGVEYAGWGHYYKFHYGPMLHNITDFSGQIAIGNEKIDTVDKRVRPLPPLLQLLGCLPPSSAHLLPNELRPLLFENNNGYYPRSFKIDLNGKRNHWEATVILPFIDVEPLRSEAERLMNGNLGNHGEAWVLKNNVKHIFEGTRIEKEFFGDTRYEIDSTHIYPTLIAPNIEAPDPYLRKIGLNIFGRKSRYQTLLLKIPEKTHDLMVPDINDLAKNLIGKAIMFNYPYLQEGFVTAMSDKNHNIRGDKTSSVYEGHDFFYSKLHSQLERGKSVVGSGGLVLTSNKEQNIILYIRPFQQLTIENGQLFKQYANFEIQVPFSYCLYGIGSKLSTHLDQFPIRLDSDPFLLRDEARKVSELNVVKRAISAESQRITALETRHNRSKKKGNPITRKLSRRKRGIETRTKKKLPRQLPSLKQTRKKVLQGQNKRDILPAPIDFDPIMKRTKIISRSFHSVKVLQTAVSRRPKTLISLCSNLVLTGISCLKKF